MFGSYRDRSIGKESNDRECKNKTRYQDALANYHGLSHAYVSVTCHCACQAVNAVKSKVKLRFRRSIILTAVADVSTGPIGVSASCSTHIHNYQLGHIIMSWW